MAGKCQLISMQLISMRVRAVMHVLVRARKQPTSRIFNRIPQVNIR